jgi:hypothetical protein
MNRPAELLFALLRDLQRLEPDVEGLDRDKATIEKRVKDEGLGFFTHALPSYCDALERGLADGRFTCPMGFARIPRGAIPKLFSGMLSKVFDAATGTILEHPSVSIVKSLRQVLRMFKKLVGSDDREEVLDRLAKDQFLKDDLASVEGYALDDRQEFILSSVCRYLMPNLDSFDPREVVCKHGPGAVYESINANQKWQALCTYSYALDQMGFDTFYSVSDDSRELELNGELNVYGASGDVAKLVTVPKSTSARRTITIEPVVRQFVQQGYNTILRREISKCGILSSCIALADQGPNQKLALEGSITGKWATIDLKSASDLLSLRLVETVFANRPLFLEGILSCRSPNVQVDGRQQHLGKFAGMGNATTFPVQSVVFASLAISALLDGERPSYRNVKRVASLVRVYGDDIIVPTDKVHQVMAWITSAGLTVNTRKSFCSGSFRESCGVDAYLGVDVTPIYVRRHPGDIPRRDPSTLAHFVAVSNHAWKEAYYDFATLIQTWVEKSLKKRLPFVRSDSGLLGWHSRQEYSEHHKWCPDTHQFLVKGPMLVNVKRKDELDGWAALLKFYHRSLDRSDSNLSHLYPETVDEDHLSMSPVRFKLRIVSRWVPAH